MAFLLKLTNQHYFNNMKLFLTSFTSVMLVAINTIILTKNFILGVFMVSFCISYIWTWNVKKIAFSTQKQRFIYSLGAGCGGVVGKMICDWFL